MRCYAELNDFLPHNIQQKTLPLNIKTPTTVGETIHSLGIPLAEVDLILVNSKSVNRSHRLFENDYVSIHSAFETFDISSIQKTHKTPLRKIIFILDAHLGKLAKYLRMLGFDTLYKNDFEDDKIIEIANNENRIILTRDKTLLKSSNVDHGYYVRSIENHNQLIEVVKKFNLYSNMKSFARCTTCNDLLILKSKKEVQHKIDEKTYRIYNEFFFCPTCNKVFWKGSHFKNMEKLFLSLL